MCELYFSIPNFSTKRSSFDIFADRIEKIPQGSTSTKTSSRRLHNQRLRSTRQTMICLHQMTSGRSPARCRFRYRYRYRTAAYRRPDQSSRR